MWVGGAHGDVGHAPCHWLGCTGHAGTQDGGDIEDRGAEALPLLCCCGTPWYGAGRWAHLCGLVTLVACAGMRIVAVARRKDRLEELQRHMHALGVPLANFLPVVCDITKEAEVGLAGGVALRRGREW